MSCSNKLQVNNYFSFCDFVILFFISFFFIVVQHKYTVQLTYNS
jgi:hypothetical protein